MNVYCLRRVINKNSKLIYVESIQKEENKITKISMKINTRNQIIGNLCYYRRLLFKAIIN